MAPRKGYNQKLYTNNYDSISWKKKKDEHNTRHDVKKPTSSRCR